MLRQNVLRMTLVVGFLGLVSTGALAQSSLRVLRSAVVVEEPAGDANVVGTVLAGEVLELLDERGSWYLVRPPDDGTEGEWRTGWVNGAMVEPLIAETTRRLRSSETAPSRPRTSTRRPTQLRGELYSYPGTETSLGWALVNDNAATSPLGFNVAATSNFNSWIGLTTEGGANFDSNNIANVQLYSILSGPKFTLRTVDRIAPFGQLLAGATYTRLSAFGSTADAWAFALQPGGGIDIVMTDTVALRFGADTRIHLNSATNKDFRFTVGITFRSNFK